MKHIDKEIASIYQQRRFRSEDLAAENRDKYLSAYPGLLDIETRLSSANAKLAVSIINDGVFREGSEEITAILNEKKDFLSKNGIPDNYDSPVYTCAICGDTGFDSSKENGRCSCYRDLLVPILYDRCNFPGIAKYTFDRFDPDVFSDRAEEETYKSKNSPRDQVIAIKEAAVKFADNFESPDMPGLFMIGNPGTGKTFMAGCIANAILRRGSSVLYLSSPEMFDIINEYRIASAAFSPDKERLEKALQGYEGIMSTDLLIIDDLGTETFNADRQPELLAVINQRTGLSRKMIITTNLTMTDLMNFYDERLISRIYGGFSVYKFFGEDLRLSLRRSR